MSGSSETTPAELNPSSPPHRKAAVTLTEGSSVTSVKLFVSPS